MSDAKNPSEFSYNHELQEYLQYPALTPSFPLLFIAFFTFNRISAVRKGILWADFACSMNIFIISLSVDPVVSNEQSIPRSLHVNDTMFTPYRISRCEWSAWHEIFRYTFQNTSCTIYPSYFPRLHVSLLIFNRLFRLDPWTWCLSKSIIAVLPNLAGRIKKEYDENSKDRIQPMESVHYFFLITTAPEIVIKKNSTGEVMKNPKNSPPVPTLCLKSA